MSQWIREALLLRVGYVIGVEQGRIPAQPTPEELTPCARPSATSSTSGARTPERPAAATRRAMQDLSRRPRISGAAVVHGAPCGGSRAADGHAAISASAKRPGRRNSGVTLPPARGPIRRAHPTRPGPQPTEEHDHRMARPSAPRTKIAAVGTLAALGVLAGVATASRTAQEQAGPKAPVVARVAPSRVVEVHRTVGVLTKPAAAVAAPAAAAPEPRRGAAAAQAAAAAPATAARKVTSAPAADDAESAAGPIASEIPETGSTDDECVAGTAGGAPTATAGDRAGRRAGHSLRAAPRGSPGPPRRAPGPPRGAPPGGSRPEPAPSCRCARPTRSPRTSRAPSSTRAARSSPRGPRRPPARPRRPPRRWWRRRDRRPLHERRPARPRRRPGRGSRLPAAAAPVRAAAAVRKGPSRPSSGPVYIGAFTLFACFSLLFASRMAAGEDPALGIRPGALAQPAPPGVLQKVVITRRISVNGMTRRQMRRRGVRRVIVVRRPAAAPTTVAAVARGADGTPAADDRRRDHRTRRRRAHAAQLVGRRVHRRRRAAVDGAGHDPDRHRAGARRRRAEHARPGGDAHPGRPRPDPGARRHHHLMTTTTDTGADRRLQLMGTRIRILVGPPPIPVCRPPTPQPTGSSASCARTTGRSRASSPDSELCALNADPRPTVPASDLLRSAVSAALAAAAISGRPRRPDAPRRPPDHRVPRVVGSGPPPGDHGRARGRARRAPPRAGPTRTPAGGRSASTTRAGHDHPPARRPARHRRQRQGPRRGPRRHAARRLHALGRGLRRRRAHGRRAGAARRVDIEHPVTGDLVGGFQVRDGAVATSGPALAHLARRRRDGAPPPARPLDRPAELHRPHGRLGARAHGRRGRGAREDRAAQRPAGRPARPRAARRRDVRRDRRDGAHRRGARTARRAPAPADRRAA